jgi:hypothetical protein
MKWTPLSRQLLVEFKVVPLRLLVTGLLPCRHIVFPIDIRTLNVKPIVELPHIEYREDEKTTGLFRFFPSKT